MQKQISIPLYHCYLRMIHSTDKYTISQEYGLDEVENTNAMCLSRGNIICLVFFEETPSINSIVHEIVHAVNKVFCHIGQEADEHNDEVAAYLAGWMAGEVEKFLKKSKNVKNV